MTTEFKQMRTWLPPLVLSLDLIIVVAVIWAFGGYYVIDKYHVVAASLLGLVVGLPLLLWRTLVASNQLKTSLRIWTDGIFANGANMLGQTAPETQWAGINTLIRLVDEHSEYMQTVVVSFCAFLRPVEQKDGTSRRNPNEQVVRIFEAMNRWFKKDAWARDTPLDLRGVWVSGIRLDSIRLNVDMTNGDIDRSCIKDVDFSGSKLCGISDWFNCRLTSLKDCTFDRVNLTQASFQGVDFTGCTFNGANISRIGLNNVSGVEKDIEADPGYYAGTLVATKAMLEPAHWDPDNPPEIDMDVCDANTGESLSLWVTGRKNQNS